MAKSNLVFAVVQNTAEPAAPCMWRVLNAEWFAGSFHEADERASRDTLIIATGGANRNAWLLTSDLLEDRHHVRDPCVIGVVALVSFGHDQFPNLESVLSGLLGATLKFSGCVDRI